MLFKIYYAALLKYEDAYSDLQLYLLELLHLAVSDKAVGNTQQHNEREKDSYRNPDIIPQRAAWNVHFKKPTDSYTDLFAQLETAGTISTRGLKPDATHYCELVFDTI